MSKCNFLAPNGESSILAAALIQKYGEDKALQIWSWIKSEQFQTQYGDMLEGKVDPNGEPTFEFIESILNKKPEKPAVQEQSKEADNTTKVERSKFIYVSKATFVQSLLKVYEEARKNPTRTYQLPFTGKDRLKLGEERLSSNQLAALLDRDDAPLNVSYDQGLFARMQNLPKRFLQSVSFDEPNPMHLDEESVKKLMDQFFVQMRDADHKPTGKYFDLDKQTEIVDTIIYRFHTLYTMMSTDPSFKDKLEGRTFLQYAKDRIYQSFTNTLDVLVNITTKPAYLKKRAEHDNLPEHEVMEISKRRMVAYTEIINAYHVAGQPNGLWNFAMDKLRRNGIVVKNISNSQGENAQPDTISTQEEPDVDNAEELEETMGHGLRDYTDSSFELDTKDTASTRMKLFLLSTEESHFEDEVPPKKIDLYIGKEDAMENILTNSKHELVFSPESAKKLGLMPLSSIPSHIAASVRKDQSQKLGKIGGTWFRLTATSKITNPAFLTQRELDFMGRERTFAERIEQEEGRVPQLGDVYVKIEKYVQEKNIPTPTENFIGSPHLARFDLLFQDLTGFLAGREPDYNTYAQALHTSEDPNFLQVLKKLEQAPDHVKKEFVSVFSTHYQRQLAVVFRKGADGFIKARVMDANRSNEILSLIRQWRENQKTAEIMTKNEEGQAVIDVNLARGIWEELGDIYYEARNNRGYNQEAVKALEEKYGYREAERMNKERKAEVKEKVKELEQRKRDLFKLIMEVNGIELDPRAVEDLFDHKKFEQLSRTASIRNLFGGFSMSDNPLGVVEVMAHRMYVATENVEDPNNVQLEQYSVGEGDDFQLYKANNPLYTEITVMTLLAKAQAKYEPDLYSQTHKSVERKTIYSFGLNSALSHAIRKLKEDALKAPEEQVHIPRYKDSYFNGESFLLDDNGKAFIKLNLSYLDGLNNEYGSRDGVTRSSMSDREQWMTALALYHKGHMMSLTHSDKTKTPLFMHIPIIPITDVMRFKNGKFQTGAYLYDLFEAEYNRMIQPGGENIKGYAEGKKHFFFFPKLNKDEMQKLVEEGVITQGEYNSVWLEDGTINTGKNDVFDRTVSKLIRSQFAEMRDATKTAWEESKLLEVGIPGERWYYDRMMRSLGMTSKRDRTEQGLVTRWFYPNKQPVPDEMVDKIRVHLMATEYTYNAFRFNTSLAQLFYGDPALTWKGSVKATMEEYSKRLAKDIAPGRDGEFSHSPTYVTITAADYTPVVKELEGIPGYQRPVEATDAQEVTTVKEHLNNVMYAYGKVTQKQYEQAMQIIRDAKGGYYRFPPELEKIIMQPTKPVAAGLRSPIDGVMPYDYVKSSSFPLYPPMTRGLEIDKLRHAMETDGVDRVNFSSAKKLGAPVKQVSIYNSDGTIDASIFSSEDWKVNSRQQMDRSEFRLQQEVPYDEDKDSILTVSQMNKLITEKVPTITKPFTFQNREVSGTELRKIKEDIRQKLITASHKKFLEKVGASYDPERNTLVFTDKKKFYKLLKDEAKQGKGYTMNDVMALASTLEDGNKLMVPLSLTPSASKFEGLLMSLVKKIVDIKMPGHSFIQASPAGFKTMQTWEESNLDQSQIVWTKPFEGELKTSHIEEGKVVPAQILVGFNYFINSGQRINIQDYIKEVDGKTMLDTERIPPELFQLIGARIPNQGHSSMLPIEIVGFLPENMGDMVVVPAAITKQMGADFDVDKLFTYHRAYKQHENSLIPIGSAPKQDYNRRIRQLNAIRSLATAEELKDSQLMQDIRVDKSQPKSLQPNDADNNLSALSLYGKRFNDLNGEQQQEAKTHAYRILNELYFEEPAYENFDLIQEFPEYLKDFAKKDNPVKEFFEADLFAQAENPNNLPITAESAFATTIDPTEEEDYLKNQYFDVHWSVLTNPEMFNSMMSPLDKADLKELAEKYNPKGESVGYLFSPAYQMHDFQSMKGAKILVGQTSLALTHNAVMQDKDITLKKVIEDGDGKERTIPSPIHLDGISLTHLSGYGQSMYKGEIRTKADNIQIQQSESVDHAKNRVIDKINLDPNTSAASLAMSRLQSEDIGTPGTEDFHPGEALSLEYNVGLLMQPVVREFSAEMSRIQDTMSTNFVPNARQATLESLAEKYYKLAMEAAKTEEHKRRVDEIIDTFLFSPDTLYQAATMEPGLQFYTLQVVAINLFAQFDAVGQQLRTLQSVTAQDTRGAGGNMLSALKVEENREKVGVPNADLFIDGVDQLFTDTGNSPTEVGTTYKATIGTATELYNEDLPYQKLQGLYDYVKEQSGRAGELSDKVKRTVFNAMRSYVFTSPKLNLFSDAGIERMRLLFSGGDRKSLALRVQKAQETWGRNNYFLQRLQTNIDPDGIRPDLVEYLAAKAPLADDYENSKAWLDMLVSDDPEKKALGNDLLIYVFATGGLQNARNFVKYIPWAAIEGSGIAPGLRGQFDKLQDLTGSTTLREQIFQHNPFLARQLSSGLKETGKTYEGAPDSFMLPTLDLDKLGSNSARELVVTVQVEGKSRQTYPTYLSYREGNKWILYKKQTLRGDSKSEGVIFARIDTLGGSKDGILEYNSSGDGMARSVYADNRAPWFQLVEPQPYMISNANLDATGSDYYRKTVMGQVGLLDTEGDYQDIVNSLNVIAADVQQPDHLRTIASVLSGLDRDPEERAIYERVFEGNRTFQFSSIELPPFISATFNSGHNILAFNSRTHRSKQHLAEDIVHELLHYHTAFMAMAMEGEEGWEKRNWPDKVKTLMRQARGFIMSNPELEDKLMGLDELRKKAQAALKDRVIREAGEPVWDMMGIGGPQTSAKYGKLWYAHSNLAEFITHVLTNAETMQFLNTIPYDGERTLLDRFKEIFSKVWDALLKGIGAKPGTVLEEAVKRTLDIVTYQQMSDLDIANANLPDMSALFYGLRNSSVLTPQIEAINKVIGKLEEQKEDLIRSRTGVIDSRITHDKRRKIEAIEEDIKQLRDEHDLNLVNEIGKKHLGWVMDINANPNATPNELMTAIRVIDMWRGIAGILYGEDTEVVNTDLSNVLEQTEKVAHRIISRLKGYLMDQSEGFLRPEDFSEKNLTDTGWISSRIRSVTSAASSRLTQQIASFIETTGRHEDEDNYRLMRELTQLEKEMKAYAGGSKKELQKLYDKMMPSDGWGLAQQYSSAWFKWRKDSVSKRNRQLATIDKSESSDAEKSQRKKAVWERFWRDVDEKATPIDTTVFFDPETGKFREGVEKAKAVLAKEVGKDHVDELLARAQERYLRYVEDRNTFFDLLDSEQERGDKTAEEVAEDKADFQNRYSPNVFFNHVNKKKTFSAANEKYVVMAPKASTKEFWNENWEEIMSDPKLADFYNRYSAIIDRLMAYLPKSIQDKRGPDFLPIVRKSVMEDSLNVPEYLKTTSERFIKSVAASEWQEGMNDRDYNRIPITYINEGDVDVEDRSRNLIGIARLFGMMALHYKHFSAAKDVIDMGSTIIKEIDKAYTGGARQMEQNGKLVTVRKGLQNALDAMQYLTDYMVYRKPKDLEFSAGKRIYTVRSEQGAPHFEANPIKQTKLSLSASKRVKELLVQREDLNRAYTNQNEEHPMGEDEYLKRLEAIDKELNKYVGFTLYGSKIGDKLIGINQLKALSYNPFSAIANMGFGLISIAIHANGKADFTGKEARSAMRLMMNATSSHLGNKNETAEKILNIMDRLGVIGDYVDTRYGKAPKVRDNKPAWKRYLDPFAMLRSTDYFMKGVTSVAVLLHKKVEVETAEGKKMISLYDALDKDGHWNEELYGKRPEWFSEDVTQQTEWDKMRNRVVRVNMILHGNQDKNSPKLVNKNILGRLIGQFRMSWLPEGWYSRFQEEHYDKYLERDVKGRYRTMLQLGVGKSFIVLLRQLLNLVPGVKMDMSNGVTLPDGRKLSESAVDMENMRRNFSEMAFGLSIAAAILMLKHIRDADDDDDKNFSLQLLINMLIRGKQDINFYASPGVFDAVTRDIVPATNVLKDYWKLVTATGKVILDDDYEFDQWMLKMTKAGLPIPQATLVNKTKYMIGKDLDTLR